MIDVAAPVEAVPLPRIAGFVRQLTHDVRNSLDLQAAFLLEVVSDAEALEELRRMRGLIQVSARQLQAVSGNFWSSTPSLIEYSAPILVEDFQARLLKNQPEQAARVSWIVRLGEESVSVDIEMLFGALQRIFENTFTFSEETSKIKADVYTEQGQLVFDLRQSLASVTSDPATWGIEPFVTSRRGAYGLGLFRARALLSLMHGEVNYSHDAALGELLTRVSLPLTSPHEHSEHPPDRRH
jgi:K+-sensing histidine kinase KdpD